MIEINDVHKSFDGKSVLAGVDLKVNPGDTLVIVGRSGCGKTVLLKILIGLLKPDSGQVLIDGTDLTRLKRNELYALRRKFALLFQGAALFDSMTVEENISLPLREHLSIPQEVMKTRVAERLADVGLPGVEQKKPAELSGGMKKRVGLARALIMNPEYILYDEPTTGLDPVMADSINQLIVSTSKKYGVTSIIVTHDMSSVYRVADHVAMLHEGRIIFYGTTDEFKQSSVHQVRQFVEGRGDLT